MQGYTYSIFSIAAILIYLMIINFNHLLGIRTALPRNVNYRGFLVGLLVYYITDAAWGILAGLGMTRLLYVDTILFFLALVVFVFMWGRFVVTYLSLGKWSGRILMWFGYMLLALNIAALVLNPFNNCVFYFEADGSYRTGCVRDVAFDLLVVFSVLIAVAVFVKVLTSHDSMRRRSIMVLLSSVTMAVAMALQIVWPLTPFTSLGCLISNCFLHVFLVADEQMEKHLKELEMALERARNAEKARSMFFSVVSHDIRTPLNAILGYSELLQDGMKSPAERDEALRSIRASGTTLLELVNDVLDLAKIDSGKMTFHPEPLNLFNLTEDVFASFRLVAAEKGVELVNRTAEVPTVMLDEHRFRQILFNLIGNAVKFTSKGSVAVAASYTGKTLEVSVIDTGCGIAKDMLTSILDPFVQVRDPSHAADRSYGTGLGLSICRSLTEAMGGNLIVESELGKGSRFLIRLPGIEPSREKVKTPGSKPVASLKNLPKHVLVVDDSPVNRAVLTALLKKAGVAAIEPACDGVEALGKLDSAYKSGDPFDFVLSDLWMPKMNGHEFVEKLRGDPRFSHLPVFAVTADTEYHRDSRTYLFTDILLKPLTYAKLTEVFASMDSAKA